MATGTSSRIKPITEASANGAAHSSPLAKERKQVIKIVSELPVEGKVELPDTWESEMHPGLIFKLKKFSNIIIRDAVMKVEEPKPPDIWIEDKERFEPNPNDPGYKEALRDYVYASSMVAVNATIVLGTEVTQVPASLKAVDDSAWIAPLTIIGLEVPPDPLNRYLCWVRWHALDDLELANLHRACRRYNGVVLSSDVEDAQDSLKSVSERDTDTEPPANA